MTEFKRQFVQDHYPPIDITILTHASKSVILKQGDSIIYIEKNKIEEFAIEMNEVRRWSSSK